MKQRFMAIQWASGRSAVRSNCLFLLDDTVSVQQDFRKIFIVLILYVLSCASTETINIPDFALFQKMSLHFVSFLIQDSTHMECGYGFQMDLVTGSGG